MKIIPQNLSEHIKRRGLKITAVARRMTTLQNSAFPELHEEPVVRQAIHRYIRGMSPTPLRAYLLSVVLAVPMKKLFKLTFDEGMRNVINNKANLLFPKIKTNAKINKLR